MRNEEVPVAVIDDLGHRCGIFDWWLSRIPNSGFHFRVTPLLEFEIFANAVGLP